MPYISDPCRQITDDPHRMALINFDATKLPQNNRQYSKSDLDNLPDAMVTVPSWCPAGRDKAPRTRGHRFASVTDSLDWQSFADAYQEFTDEGHASLGFVLSDRDPFTCIDLDIKADSPPEHIQRCLKIVEAFGSYTERSLNGLGYHIWLRGDIGAGCRREGIEVYSRERFIICTGNHVAGTSLEITANDELLAMLVGEIRAAQGVATSDHVVNLDTSTAEVLPDEEIWRRATIADNSQKFLTLWHTPPNGPNDAECREGVNAQGYPSQSEADLSLLSMLCFYSPHDDQCRRMFRYSNLGKRKKAIINDRYIDRTLRIIRGRQAKEKQAVARAMGFVLPTPQATPQNTHQRAEIDTGGAANVQPAPVVDALPQVDPVAPVRSRGPIDYPPGFLGHLAEWCYAASPMPVRETAIVTAVSAMAGMIGSAFSVYGSGLNQYLILLAPSGTGKEALANNLSRIRSHMALTVPGMESCINVNRQASAQAILSTISDDKCSVMYFGEIGKTIRAFGNTRDANAQGIVRTLLELYGKSAVGSNAGGVRRAVKDNNTSIEGSVCLSVVGESTPEVFYKALTTEMMEDGFLSRFLVSEYRGMRGDLNKSSNIPIYSNIMQHLTQMGIFVTTVQDPVSVRLDPDVQEADAQFEEYCKNCINANPRESKRQMWTRAHFKTIKLAALLAACDQPRNPVVNMAHYVWARDYVLGTVAIMQGEVEEHDFDGEGVEGVIVKFLRRYFTHTGERFAGASREMRSYGVVGRSAIINQIFKLKAIAKHGDNRSKVIEEALKGLVNRGYIEEAVKEAYPSTITFGGGKYYRLSSAEALSETMYSQIDES